MEDVITLLRRKLLSILFLSSVILVSLFVLNFFLLDEAREILNEEEYLVETRISSARISVEGNVLPIQMINEHMEASLERVLDGRQVITDLPDIPYLEDQDIYYLVGEDDDWGMLGIGADFDFAESAAAESVVFAMQDLFAGVIERLPDSTWIYFISPENLVFSSPPFPPVSSDMLGTLRSRQHWLQSLPENNPSGRLTVTDPYEDLGGMGYVITMSKGVFVNGEFFGVISMDITVEDLGSTLELGQSLGFSAILDENRKVVSSQDDLMVGSVYGYIPEYVSDYGSFWRFEKDFVIEKNILEGDLFFAHRVPMSVIKVQALVREIPLILTLVITNVLVLLVMYLRTSYTVVKTERDFSRRLLSIVGHDLQSPLSVTRQATEVLTETKNWDALDLIRRSNLSAINLLKDLSYWGMSRLGEVTIEPTPCLISSVFERVSDILKPSAELKGITIETATTATTVLADPDILSAVLRNLLSNAVKFSRPDKTVRLVAEPGLAGYVILRVSDDGDGMDDEQVHSIMDRTPLSSRPGTRGEKGSGIGLVLVTSLCDQVGWPLSVTSCHDEGTTFTISVPVA